MIRKNKSSGKRQHTIPRLYLKRFLSPGFIYRHGELKPTLVPNCTNVAVHEHYYGRPNNGLPYLDSMNGLIEHHCGYTLEKLITNPSAIDSDDRFLLSYLLANLWIRNPIVNREIKNRVSDLNKRTETMLERMTNSQKQINPELIKNWEENGSPTRYNGQLVTRAERVKQIEQFDGKHGYLLNATGMYRAMKPIATCIQKMAFILCTAPIGCNFITCDRPLVQLSRITGLVETGWENDDASGIIALSPKVFLVMMYHKDNVIIRDDLNAARVAETNSILLQYSDKEVYCSQQDKQAYLWMRSPRQPSFR